ncbi:type VII secretion target [Catellatospora sp. KI3]|uniref:type VII secretion target n=1 Tax=Catellatospora sp. KI3 TaxID=3041620 RepID=UPI0024832677|nr:type VII secretion target [Catellatospora sp. KI3]MDI1465317.1 type VII secretion target [Catellatospora sp. KI3]
MHADTAAMRQVADGFRDVSTALRDEASHLGREELPVVLDDYVYAVAKVPEALEEFLRTWSTELTCTADACGDIVHGLATAAQAYDDADKNATVRTR